MGGERWGVSVIAIDYVSTGIASAAFVLSLCVAIAPLLTRPRLELVTGAEKPWVRYRTGVPGYEVRIACRNRSRWPAKNVTVRCELFSTGGGPAARPGWGKPDLVSGIYLPWYEGGEQISPTGVDLARGGARYARLFVIHMNGEKVGATVGRNGLWRAGTALQGVVVAAADNCKPVRARVVVTGIPSGSLPNSGCKDQDLPELAIVFGPPDIEVDPLIDTDRKQRAVWSNSRRRRHNPN